jgi:hypothetical protein
VEYSTGFCWNARSQTRRRGGWGSPLPVQDDHCSLERDRSHSSLVSQRRTVLSEPRRRRPSRLGRMRADHPNVHDRLSRSICALLFASPLVLEELERLELLRAWREAAWLANQARSPR